MWVAYRYVVMILMIHRFSPVKWVFDVVWPFERVIRKGEQPPRMVFLLGELLGPTGVRSSPNSFGCNQCVIYIYTCIYKQINKQIDKKNE